jgi:hypothetical protein
VTQANDRLASQFSVGKFAAIKEIDILNGKVFAASAVNSPTNRNQTQAKSRQNSRLIEKDI